MNEEFTPVADNPAHAKGDAANEPLNLPEVTVTALLLASQSESLPDTLDAAVPPPDAVIDGEKSSFAEIAHVTIPGAAPEYLGGVADATAVEPISIPATITKPAATEDIALKRFD